MAAWLPFQAVVERLPGTLDGQLRQDSGLTHVEYMVLAMLSEAPGRTLRMTALAARTNATPPRLSHVVRRLEDRDLVTRAPSPGDGRAVDATLTEAGWDLVVRAAPGHVEQVRRSVLDPLTPDQVDRLGEIASALLAVLDPHGAAALPPVPATDAGPSCAVEPGSDRAPS
ncbi:MarR family winged helix-turn-helix transcriptional regulator [Cellulomonas endophytica]|uniref:MarR family winged helix-turn-helix transcriptional regulator n=1 Tax=Cellulomonas endophytica TaxID=2494735 RepID=UPI001010785E|nr:MarR family transcriptional regulator [Cellulomonas endophytica]